jgi:hypothetical protein
MSSGQGNQNSDLAMWKCQKELTKEKIYVLPNIALSNSENDSKRKTLLVSLVDQCNQSNDYIAWSVPPSRDDVDKYYNLIVKFLALRTFGNGNVEEYLEKKLQKRH